MAFCQHRLLCRGKLGSSPMQAGNKHVGTCGSSARADAFKRIQAVTNSWIQQTARDSEEEVR